MKIAKFLERVNFLKILRNLFEPTQYFNKQSDSELDYG